ncbi:MAG: DUF167 domain-containing protein [Nanoarchaeota archaeon]
MNDLLKNKRVSVKVRPNAKETRITGQDDDTLLIDLAAPAEKNKANIELLKFLKRTTKRTARLTAGATSRNKVVAFD